MLAFALSKLGQKLSTATAGAQSSLSAGSIARGRDPIGSTLALAFKGGHGVCHAAVRTRLSARYWLFAGPVKRPRPFAIKLHLSFLSYIHTYSNALHTTSYFSSLVPRSSSVAPLSLNGGFDPARGRRMEIYIYIYIHI